MMVTLGAEDQWTYDETTGSWIPKSNTDPNTLNLSYYWETMGFKTGSGGSSSSSNSGAACIDTSNWTLSLDPTTGKCYSVCAAGNQAIEVDPKECRSLIPKRPASTGTGTGTGDQKPKEVKEVNWMTQKTIIDGLPNWVVVVGGAALAAVVLNN
jgi:hypothetical protein